MDWTKALGYFSNVWTIAGLFGIVIAVLMLTPDADWAGNVISVVVGGMVGYLKGISTGSSVKI